MVDNETSNQALYQQVTKNQRVLRFNLSIALIFVIYLCFEVYVIVHGQWSMDDFWLTYHNLEYARGLPYRDFWPYKTVLGYYIFLWPLLVFKHHLMVYEVIKFWLLFINIVCMAIAAKQMTKFYCKDSVLIAFGFIVFSDVFLLYSTEIRVDILAFWACLFSILAILDKRFWIGGLWLGLGFMICQKVLWYWAATNVVIMLQVPRESNCVVKALRFNIGFFSLVLLYFIFWGSLASFHQVFRSLVLEPYVLNNVTTYLDYFAGSRLNFMFYPLKNEQPWLLSFPFAVIASLLLASSRIRFELGYVVVILVFLLSSKQPFRYLYLAALPALLVFYAQAFTLIGLGTGLKLGFYSKLGFLGFLMIVGLYHATKLVDNQYQRYNYHLLQDLTANRFGYLAGVPLLLDHAQPILGLTHLTFPSIEYINHPSAKLLPVMQLQSLYFHPVDIAMLIQEMKKKAVLVYVDNNRLHQLSDKFQQFLDSQYQHFFASIFIYAPLVQAGEHQIEIKFSGKYQIKSQSLVYLDNVSYPPMKEVFLPQGKHSSRSNFDYRLVFRPKLNQPLDTRFKHNQWQRMLE